MANLGETAYVELVPVITYNTVVTLYSLIGIGINGSVMFNGNVVDIGAALIAYGRVIRVGSGLVIVKLGLKVGHICFSHGRAVISVKLYGLVFYHDVYMAGLAGCVFLKLEKLLSPACSGSYHSRQYL